MGQKTHPKGFRLVTTQKHLSEWYTNALNYPSLIEEDYLIRSKVYEFFNDSLSIAKIEINRMRKEEKRNEYIHIQIYSLFPRIKEMLQKIPNYFNSSIFSQETPETKELFALQNIDTLINSKENIKEFTAFLLKQNTRNVIRFLQIKTKKNYHISLKFIKNPFENPVLIAKFIGDQLEKRTPFRRAVKQTIKKIQKTTMRGVKVQVSGRLNGAEIARSEWKRYGKIPLHTLKAKIDYTHQMAQTIYGVIGIKVWLYIGNKERKGKKEIC